MRLQMQAAESSTPQSGPWSQIEHPFRDQAHVRRVAQVTAPRSCGGCAAFAPTVARAPAPVLVPGASRCGRPDDSGRPQRGVRQRLRNLPSTDRTPRPIASSCVLRPPVAPVAPVWPPAGRPPARRPPANREASWLSAPMSCSLRVECRHDDRDGRRLGDLAPLAPLHARELSPAPAARPSETHGSRVREQRSSGSEASPAPGWATTTAAVARRDDSPGRGLRGPSRRTPPDVRSSPPKSRPRGRSCSPFSSAPPRVRHRGHRRQARTYRRAVVRVHHSA